MFIENERMLEVVKRRYCIHIELESELFVFVYMKIDVAIFSISCSESGVHDRKKVLLPVLRSYLR